ncbi:hypothetical protein D3C81_1901920 [compost metagenome]|nr:hypothetical protein [Pseudomonas vranovensis]
MGIQVNGQAYAGGDERHFHGVTDTQPQNRQRNQRQGRHRTLDLDDTINQRIAHPRQAGEQG